MAVGALVCAGVLSGCITGTTGSVGTPDTSRGVSTGGPTASSEAPSASTASPSTGPTGAATGQPPTAPMSTPASASPSPSAAPTTPSPSAATQPTKPRPKPKPKPKPSPKRQVTVPPPDDRPAVPLPANPIGISPLNGLPIGTYKPVLVMKLDNTRNAQPHAGLIDADAVYIEEVEYGITRLAAVFSSRVPARIGPIRSARITDIDLFAQYGRPAFGYSGAQRKMLPYLKAASIYDVSPYGTGVGYSRDGRRRSPYNLYFDGRKGLARAPKATKARDMGFVFDATRPEGGRNARTATMSWGYASAGFTYDKKDEEYRISLNGQPARAEEWSGGQRAATVVVQYVKQTKSQFWDKGGGNTPHARTIGKGTAMVLRDGRVWKTTWRRPNAKSGTTFTLGDGSLMPFKPGQLWVVLLDKKRTATIAPLTKPKAPKPKPKPTAKPTPAPEPIGSPSAAPPTPSAPTTQAPLSPSPVPTSPAGG